jgi:hypothetical protein
VKSLAQMDRLKRVAANKRVATRMAMALDAAAEDEVAAAEEVVDATDGYRHLVRTGGDDWHQCVL